MARWLILLALSLAATVSAAEEPAPPVALTYLGNMGVLLEAGDKRVVIDGLHRGELAEYAAVPAALLGPLESATGTFARLDLALTTHRHRDHFDARSVAARLRADSRVVYLAANETVAALRRHDPGLSAGDRLVAVTPQAGRSSSPPTPPAGISLTVLGLPHNPTRSPRVENVGFLVALGGLRVLHVGDADPTRAVFAPHALREVRVDVAILPFWYLTGSRALVQELIAPGLLVAAHVPPADAASIRSQIAGVDARAIVLTEPGERHRLRAAVR